MLTFFSSFCGCWVISNSEIFHWLKLQNKSETYAANWRQKLAADLPSLIFSKNIRPTDSTIDAPRNTKGGSITVPLTSCLAGLD